MRAIRVFIVEDHPGLRHSLRMMLEAEPDVEVIGEARDGREAVDRLTTLRPNVIITDLSMPELGGVAAVRALHGACPEAGIVVLSALVGDYGRAQLTQAGAAEAVSKSDDPDLWVAAVRRAAGPLTPAV